MKRIIQIICLIACFTPSLIKAELSISKNRFLDYSINSDTIADNLIISNVFNYQKEKVFYVYSENPNAIISFHIKIYNRWGAIVFESNDIDEGWDGEKFSAGVYYYNLEVELEDYTYYDSSLVLKQSGSISLVK